MDRQERALGRHLKKRGRNRWEGGEGALKSGLQGRMEALVWGGVSKGEDHGGG